MQNTKNDGAEDISGKPEKRSKNPGYLGRLKNRLSSVFQKGTYFKKSRQKVLDLDIEDSGPPSTSVTNRPDHHEVDYDICGEQKSVTIAKAQGSDAAIQSKGSFKNELSTIFASRSKTPVQNISEHRAYSLAQNEADFPAQNGVDAGAKHKLAVARQRQRRAPTNKPGSKVTVSMESLDESFTLDTGLSDFFSSPTSEPPPKLLASQEHLTTDDDEVFFRHVPKIIVDGDFHPEHGSLVNEVADVHASPVDRSSPLIFEKLNSSGRSSANGDLRLKSGSERVDAHASLVDRSSPVSPHVPDSLRLSSRSSAFSASSSSEVNGLNECSSSELCVTAHKSSVSRRSQNNSESGSPTYPELSKPSKSTDRPRSLMYPTPLVSVIHSSPRCSPTHPLTVATHTPPLVVESGTSSPVELKAIDLDLPSDFVSNERHSPAAPFEPHPSCVNHIAEHSTDAPAVGPKELSDGLKVRPHLRPVVQQQPEVKIETNDDLGSVSNRASVFGAVLRTPKARPQDTVQPTTQTGSSSQPDASNELKRKSKVFALVKNFDGAI